jgi:hypothetical protein
MELNGLANIKMILQEALTHDKVDYDVYEEVNTQLDLLERYMIAYSKRAENAVNAVCHGGFLVQPEPLYWHEVRENITNYPTLREIVEEARQELKGK